MKILHAPLVAGREHWAFFYRENGPNAQPRKLVSYLCLTQSMSGVVPLEHAIEIARSYERQGANIVLDQNVDGENLPLSAEERFAFVAADPKIERETLKIREHPGKAYLDALLATIPHQIAKPETD